MKIFNQLSQNKLRLEYLIDEINNISKSQKLNKNDLLEKIKIHENQIMRYVHKPAGEGTLCQYTLIVHD